MSELPALPGTFAVAPAFGDLDAQERTLQGSSSSSQVGGLLGALGKRALGFASRLLRFLHVDLGGHVRGLGHDHDLVGRHLEEPAGNREVLFLAALPDAQFANSERADEGRVVRQDPELALDPGAIDGVDLARERETISKVSGISYPQTSYKRPTLRRYATTVWHGRVARQRRG
jgi:hypothetical protein